MMSGCVSTTNPLQSGVVAMIVGGDDEGCVPSRCAATRRRMDVRHVQTAP